MVKNFQSIPIITIDGTAGSGKGTVSVKLSKELGWNLLDSGMLYRAVALSYIWYLEENGLKFDDLNINQDSANITSLALNLQVIFAEQEVYLQDFNRKEHKVSKELKSEFCGNLASKLAVLPTVRAALLTKQREFLAMPGLVADGRDMGTVVFPEAKLKFFLDADPKIRGLRRHMQLKELGVDGNLYNRAEELYERDLRDQQRELAPLKPARDAVQIDTTRMTIEEVFEVIIKQVKLII